MERNTVVLLTVVFLAASGGMAQSTNTAAVPRVGQSRIVLDGGADFRFRDELKDHMPGTGVTAKPSENVFRFRSRVWGAASYEDYTVYGRVAHAFRYYTMRTGKNNNGFSTYEFPDEAFIDALYVDAKNLLNDRVDLRVGRQELKYGDGRIISDGSPGDGSRSTYFDAVKATYHVTDKTALDAFGVYMDDYDHLAVGPGNRALETANGYTDNKDSGAGLYLNVGELKEFPFEVYYVWENETHTHNIGKKEYGRDFHTVGTRLLPKFTDRFSGELESAVQMGKTDDGRDIFAYMEYAGLTYQLAPDSPLKPYVTPAFLYLSGDKHPNSGEDNNWNPVFNRTTWLSVLMADQYKNYAWSNLIYPNVGGGVTIFGDQKLRGYTGPVFVAEDNQGALNGEGEETYKGYLTFVRYEAPLIKGLFGKRGDLSHAVQFEIFEPGDYYETDTTAFFLRYELKAKF